MGRAGHSDTYWALFGPIDTHRHDSVSIGRPSLHALPCVCVGSSLHALPCVCVLGVLAVCSRSSCGRGWRPQRHARTGKPSRQTSPTVVMNDASDCSAWSEWSGCSKTCGGGSRSRSQQSLSSQVLNCEARFESEVCN